MLHPNVKTKIIDTVYMPKIPKVKYCGMHNAIARIAKEHHCSMNKARKYYTDIARCGLSVVFYGENKNHRIYTEEAVREAIKTNPINQGIYYNVQIGREFNSTTSTPASFLGELIHP